MAWDFSTDPEFQEHLRASFIPGDVDRCLAGRERIVDRRRSGRRARVGGADFIQDFLEVFPRDQEAGLLEGRQPVVVRLALRLRILGARRCTAGTGDEQKQNRDTGRPQQTRR